MELVKSQLVRYVRSLPSGARTDFKRYLHLRANKPPRRGAKSRTYWRELPLWLFDSYQSSRAGRDLSRAFFDHVRWGQQCLFLAIRIQDDLFDGDSTSPALVYISDQFLIEAGRTFSHLITRSQQFWDIYHSCLTKTTGSILEVDGLQRKAIRDLRELEEAYAGVNALFKIGPAAICLRARRMKDFPSVSRFCDEMAITGQIMDDMRDLGEDLARQRFNFVASYFLRRRTGPLRQRQSPVDTVKNLLLSGSMTELFQILHHHIDLAESALEKLNLPGSVGFLRHYRENLRHREGDLNRKRVDFILNSLV